MSLLNSVITNVYAQVALQSLNATNSQLQATQKQISTGYRVADATDDGAAFAVAQRVRADVGGLTTVNQQIGNANGLVGTAVTGLTSVSNSMTSAKQLLVEIGDNSISDDQRKQYIQFYQSLVQQVANTVDGSTYNGESLLGTTGGTAGADKQVITSDTGSQSKIHGEDMSTIANALAALIGGTVSGTGASLSIDFSGLAATSAQSAALAALAAASTATNSFAALQVSVANKLNQAGADSKFLDATASFNSQKIDSLNAGLGALVDADLSKESAALQALQIRQQLGTQALSLANTAPQALLKLFG
jgi:flagellin